jgi:two-component system sensor histidine kinase CpxA
MKSLFRRMFLWFCGGTGVVVFGILAGYVIANPDQLPFGWPDVGRGAIISAGHVAAGAYEHGGAPELTAYLASLAQDTGLRGALFDHSRELLGGKGIAPELLNDVASEPENELFLRSRTRVAGFRFRSDRGKWYAFIASVPPREARGRWSRLFLVALVLTGALLCYALARQVTFPIVYLRGLTSRVAGGDLAARVALPKLLGRQDEIGDLARDFNRMASRIETLVQSQRRLIADVSHELRSPITRLQLAVGLLRRSEPVSRPDLSRIEREVERLNTLIAQLLTLSRLEGMGEAPPMEVVDLHALVEEITADADFEAASLDRSVRLVESTPCSICGARDLLRSAVENVVRNALRYTGSNTQVQVRLRRDRASATATIVVEDQGPGVPEHALERMFEPFYRVDDARDRRTGGAGLGLAIAQQIVGLHGGSVRAANREEGGLEVQIILPATSSKVHTISPAHLPGTKS